MVIFVLLNCSQGLTKHTDEYKEAAEHAGSGHALRRVVGGVELNLPLTNHSHPYRRTDGQTDRRTDGQTENPCQRRLVE